MEVIFHEKQEGSLCAQHCLNALLQGSYFTAVDLAEIGKQLDETEKATMAEGGTYTESYQQFLQQPSNNYDDSGFFSLQVLQTAVRVWSLDLLPLEHSSALAKMAKTDPCSQQAYICNFREHWLTVRKLGNQWFNLNSLLTGPELISDTYLSMFLKQLETDGYHIYLVIGQLPHCEADELLKICPVVQPIKPELIRDPAARKKKSPERQDPAMQRALKESAELLDSDDTALQEALKASMQGYVIEPDISDKPSQKLAGASSEAPAFTPSAEELRKKRLAFLDKSNQDVKSPKEQAGSTAQTENGPHKNLSNSSSIRPDETKSALPTTSAGDHDITQNEENKKVEDLSEEEQIKKALEMSMQ